MANPSPIKTRIAWHCDPQCGCQYFELLPEDRICIARMTKDEQDALLRECGEALERARNAIGLAIDQLPTCYAQGVCGHEIEIVRTTLAKIKEQA